MDFLERFFKGIKVVRAFRNFPILFAAYFGFRKSRRPLAAVLWNGTKYQISTKNLDARRAFFETFCQIWMEDSYGLLKNNLSVPSVIIDIGAHIGIFSIFAAKKIKDATVYSFEPDPGNFDLLQRNVKLNELEKRINLFPVAVSGKSGKRRLFRSKISPVAHSLFKDMHFTMTNRGGYEVINVNSITLKEVFEANKIRNCDFLKLDCEGAEFGILLNAPSSILQKLKRIAIGYHEGATRYNHDDLAKFLKENGFKVYSNLQVRIPTKDFYLRSVRLHK